MLNTANTNTGVGGLFGANTGATGGGFFNNNTAHQTFNLGGNTGEFLVNTTNN